MRKTCVLLSRWDAWALSSAAAHVGNDTDSKKEIIKALIHQSPESCFGFNLNTVITQPKLTKDRNRCFICTTIISVHCHFNILCLFQSLTKKRTNCVWSYIISCQCLFKANYHTPLIFISSINLTGTNQCCGSVTFWYGSGFAPLTNGSGSLQRP